MLVLACPEQCKQGGAATKSVSINGIIQYWFFWGVGAGCKAMTSHLLNILSCSHRSTPPALDNSLLWKVLAEWIFYLDKDSSYKNIACGSQVLPHQVPQLSHQLIQSQLSFPVSLTGKARWTNAAKMTQVNIRTLSLNPGKPESSHSTLSFTPVLQDCKGCC